MLLIKNIKKLVQTEEVARSRISGRDMAFLPLLEDAWLLIKGDVIEDFGPMLKRGEMPGDPPGETGRDMPHGNDLQQIDAAGKLVFPSFCDSHTHLVHAGSREMEFIDKIRGLSYEEIARRGGGILNSARLLKETPDDELYDQSLQRTREIIMPWDRRR
jgi:imidazolonepropionase